MIVTYNIELNMSEDSFRFWDNLLGQTMFAYNESCNRIVDENIPLGLEPVHQALYNSLRSKYSSLPAQSVIKIYKDAIGSIRSQRANFAKIVKSKPDAQWETPQKHNKSMHLDKRLYSNITLDGICITGEVKNKRTFYPFVLFDQARHMLTNYKTKDPLIFIRDGRIFLSLPFDVPEKPVLSEVCTGVDLGMKRLFVTSEGYYFTDKKYIKERRKVRYLKRCLKERGTKSAKRHLKKVRHRERNLCKDMCQRASNALLKHVKGTYVILEDLTKIKQSTSCFENGYKRKTHNNRMSQIPFYQFKEVLTYKATLFGKKVVSVSPRYTSQMDSRTGKRDGNRVGCRYYCVDGKVFDADWNASVNIAQRSKHPLSTEVLPVDGGLIALSGRHLSVCHTSKTACLGQAHVL